MRHASRTITEKHKCLTDENGEAALKSRCEGRSTCLLCLNTRSGDTEPRMPSTTSQSRSTRGHRTRGRRAATSAAADGSATKVRTGTRVADRSDLCEVNVINRQKLDVARAALPSAAILGGLTELLRALGDPTRLQIVLALATDGVDELCVCDLATLVEVSDSAVSHSLRTLRELEVVRYRKVGKIAYYSLDDAHVGELVREGVQHMERTR